jgi:hypothetical protein
MEFLKVLGIEATNKGTSTGSVFFDSSSSLLESKSPVNGQKIGAWSMKRQSQNIN